MKSLRQGAVGLAIWVPSVTNQPKERDPYSRGHGYSSVSPVEERSDGGNDLELSIVGGNTNLEIDEDAILDELKV